MTVTLTEIKVFQINDMEWYAGTGTPEQILTSYMKNTGCSHEDATGDIEDLPRELTDDEMDKLKFTYQDDKKLKNSISFRDQLNKMIADRVEFPCHFACTEW